MKKGMYRVVSFLLCLLMLSQVFVVGVYSTVKSGSKGNDVKTLQRMLNEVADAGLDVDGSFGPATLDAVKAYQKGWK